MLNTMLHNDAERDKIMSFIRSCTRPMTIQRDSILAIYYYREYEKKLHCSNELPVVSKPYFLYVWLCMKVHSVITPVMKDYNYFSDENIIVGTMSYRDFTQMYASSHIYVGELNVQYECLICSVIYAKYPMSLRSIFDRVQLHDVDSQAYNVPNNTGDTLGDVGTVYNNVSNYSVLTENNVIMVKRSPVLMEKQSDDVVDRTKRDRNNVFICFYDTTVDCDESRAVVTSRNMDVHERVMTVMRNNLHSDNVGDVTRQQTFCLPNRELNYAQMLDWFSRNSVTFAIVEGEQHVTTTTLFRGCTCDLRNKVLDVNKCYYSGDKEVFRLKGDVVLELVVVGNCNRAHIDQSLLKIYNERNDAIVENYIDPMYMNVSNIAKLRATNSTVFDSVYCRKAPPNIQPLVITKDNVQQHLNKGKMVLIYDGHYYTVTDSQHSGGYDYIGMMNRFGDYDPTRQYVPIIRTYKTNHLLSKIYKEFKAWLLRHSVDPYVGYISPDDLLLPEQLKHLYKIPLYNPDLQLNNVHSKKTIIVKNNNVVTAELPDYVKSLLGTSRAKRLVLQASGTKLLESCQVTRDELLSYCMQHHNRYIDLLMVSELQMQKDIDSGNVDHRLYGKIIEDLINASLVVFSMDGVVPYRHSMCEKTDCVLLFISNNAYDRIIVQRHHEFVQNIDKIRTIVNSAPRYDVSTLRQHIYRDIDYTYTFLRLVGHLTSMLERLNMHIIFVQIHESQCESIVENTYKCNVYYEGIVSSADNKYSDDFTIHRKHNYKVKVSLSLLLEIFKHFVHSCATELGEVRIFSPVDMSVYHPWNLTLEDALYYSSRCYCLQEYEEIQCIMR